MKPKSTFVCSVFAATCLCVQAQNVPKPGIDMPAVTVYGSNTGIAEPNGELYGPVRRFTEFIGMDVWNFQNQKLGEIRTITADLENARIVEVFISPRGGFLGQHAIVTPVPSTALTFQSGREIARLNMSKARFDAAPKGNGVRVQLLDR